MCVQGLQTTVWLMGVKLRRKDCSWHVTLHRSGHIQDCAILNADTHILGVSHAAPCQRQGASADKLQVEAATYQILKVF